MFSRRSGLAIVGSVAVPAWASSSPPDVFSEAGCALVSPIKIEKIKISTIIMCRILYKSKKVRIDDVQNGSGQEKNGETH